MDGDRKKGVRGGGGGVESERLEEKKKEKENDINSHYSQFLLSK